MRSGSTPPERLTTMRVMTPMDIQMAMAWPRRSGAAFSARNGMKLTKTKPPAIPPRKESASSTISLVIRQRPRCETVRHRDAPMRKGRRPMRSLRMPVGMATRPEARGNMPASWPMKSSRKPRRMRLRL